MKAMILERVMPVEEGPLRMIDSPDPVPGPKEILVRISACGICHTELDEIEGRVASKLPIIPGHEIVGRVEALGPGVT
jgi:alcohol dehydrogenase, propanol-preferring